MIFEADEVMARFDTIGTTTSSTSLVYPSLVTFLSPPGGEGGPVVYAFRLKHRVIGLLKVVVAK